MERSGLDNYSIRTGAGWPKYKNPPAREAGDGEAVSWGTEDRPFPSSEEATEAVDELEATEAQLSERARRLDVGWPRNKKPDEAAEAVE